MTDLDFLALHGLAVRKSGTPESVAAILGRDPQEIGQALEAAAASGRVASGKGIFMLTGTGRDWLASQYGEVCADVRASPDSGSAYERFERVNRELLILFTDWQTVPTVGGRVSNDHSDTAYDQAIVDRLGDLHDRAARPLGMFTELDSRFGLYLPRLDEAYDRVLAGEREYVSGVRVDSYHTVWFELHEDLLRILGRTREVYE